MLVNEQKWMICNIYKRQHTVEMDRTSIIGPSRILSIGKKKASGSYVGSGSSIDVRPRSAVCYCLRIKVTTVVELHVLTLIYTHLF